MPWIKVLLIASSLLVLVVLFRQRKRVVMRAGTRLAAVVLFLLAVVSIAIPDIPQAVAERVGVVRGTDLLLYVLVVVFALSTLGLYFRLRETDQQVHQLARAWAIQEALRREEQHATRGGAATGSADPGSETGSNSGDGGNRSARAGGETRGGPDEAPREAAASDAPAAGHRQRSRR